MKKMFSKIFLVILTILITGCSANKEDISITVNDETDINVQHIEEELSGEFIECKDKTVTPELEEMFKKALVGLTGASYTPEELVATQVVAGTNYKFLCDGVKTTNPIVTGTYYVTIYKDLDGNVSVTDIEIIEEKQDEIESKKEQDVTKMKFWVVFFDKDGNELQREALQYGSIPTYHSDISNYVDNEFWYRQVSWTDKNGNEVKEFKPITGNTRFYAVYEKAGLATHGTHSKKSKPDIDPSCFAQGTMINISNNKLVKVEDIKAGDYILAFNHDKGFLEKTKVFGNFEYKELKHSILTLTFSNGSTVIASGAHSFFSKNDNKYISITDANFAQYIGDSFYNAVDDSWVILKKVSVSHDYLRTFILITYKNINCIADGMLTCEDGVYTSAINVFDFNSDLKYNQIDKENSINKYGLWKIEDQDYITDDMIKALDLYNLYDAVNLQYVNIIDGKHLSYPYTIKDILSFGVKEEMEFVDNNLE